MAKLYPPSISGIIPAFYGGTITVPFVMNRAVSRTEVGGFSLKVKNISNDLKATLSTSNISALDGVYKVIFSFNNNFTPTPGQYYKVQLAYIDKEGTVGHYSTVGVVKCTYKPKVVIKGSGTDELATAGMNAHIYDYTAVYTTSLKDSSEKLYSYRWILRNPDGEIVQDSGVQLHNATGDDSPNEATEVFKISRDFAIGDTYTLQFLATTTNGLTLHTPRYNLVQKRSIASEIDVDLHAELNYENGVIILSFSRSGTNTVSGTFLLSRANQRDGNEWAELKRFDLHNELYTEWGFTDYTIEQGQYYVYSLQQYNENGIYSERILSNNIYSDFEDAFLFDGQRQLCIRYNPKVSTYKRDIPEAKVDTIGSKYPFFTRNGNVNYKEFALSGLISYQADPDGMYKEPISPSIDYFPTDLVSENISAERDFKNDVLDWLNDGLPKLLRTPAEGNYLVRLMNVSMSPIDSLSRMLHNFTCNAYEIDEITNEALQKYHIINSSEQLSLQTRWVSVVLNTLPKNANNWTPISTRTATSISVVDMVPGSQIRLTFTSGEQEVIAMGITGVFKFDGTDITLIEVKVDSDKMPGIITYSYTTKQVGTFGEVEDVTNYEVAARQYIGHSYQYNRYSWTTHIITAADLAGETSSGDEVVDETNRQQMIGQQQGSLVPWYQVEYIDNIMNDISDMRTTVSHLYYIRARRREVRTLYIPATTTLSLADLAWTPNGLLILYKDRELTEPITVNDWDRWSIYEIREVRHYIDKDGNVVDYDDELDFNAKKNSGYYVDAEPDRFYPKTEFMIDGASNWEDEFATENDSSNDNAHNLFLYSNQIFMISLNDELIEISDMQDYYLKDCSTIKSIIPGIGTVIEIGYAAQDKIFKQETTSKVVKNYKLAWTKTRDNWLTARQNNYTQFTSWSYSPMVQSVTEDSTKHNRDLIVGVIHRKYRSFYSALTSSLANYKIKGGDIE